MPRIIYVHGRGLKPPADVERKLWLEGLNRGLARLTPDVHQVADDDNFRLAYWSDLFYPPQAMGAGAPGVPAAGASDAAAGLTPTQATAIRALVDRFWAWRLPQPAPAPAIDPTTREFEDNFVRDAIKFFGLGFADTCAGPLRKQLEDVPSGDPVLVVSHSFGTVLAYEALVLNLPALNAARQQAGLDELHVDAWVTMGTPLSWVWDLQTNIPGWQERLLVEADQGLQPALADAREALASIGDAVRGKFAQALQGAPEPVAAVNAPLAVFQLGMQQFPPRGVDRWFNIYDPRDPVACAGGFSTLVGGLEVGRTFLCDGKQRAFDISIRNDACPPQVTGVDMRAHMDYTGYGQCAQLAQIVADFWQRSAAAWPAAT